MIKRYDIDAWIDGMGISSEESDTGEWVKWEDVKGVLRECRESKLKHERQKYALELSYGIYDKKEESS